MSADMRVSCLLERHWDVATKSFTGRWEKGVLMGISVETDRENKVFPVGIVALDAGPFQSVPIAFLKKEEIEQTNP